MSKQAAAPATWPITADAFSASDGTTLFWLGNAGLLINSRGTLIMVDPLLEGFDMPLLIDMPILAQDVPHLDAVLVTHADCDHFSRATCSRLAPVCDACHGTPFVAAAMRNEIGLPCGVHDIGGRFPVRNVTIAVTPADHTWQEGSRREECCGFLVETPDGTVWAPGDSRLMPDHLEMAPPDAILFDFSDDPWHIGLEGAVRLANAYPAADLILSHWGSVDAPDLLPFNGDPARLAGRIRNPERIRRLAPGEPFSLVRKEKGRHREPPHSFSP